MIKYNVFHIEFDVDDEFGDDWSISKSDFQVMTYQMQNFQ